MDLRDPLCRKLLNEPHVFLLIVASSRRLFCLLLEGAQNPLHKYIIWEIINVYNSIVWTLEEWIIILVFVY